MIPKTTRSLSPEDVPRVSLGHDFYICLSVRLSVCLSVWLVLLANAKVQSVIPDNTKLSAVNNAHHTMLSLCWTVPASVCYDVPV